jgi:hypothetical protein
LPTVARTPASSLTSDLTTRKDLTGALLSTEVRPVGVSIMKNRLYDPAV